MPDEELEQLKADAARYRYIRAHHIWTRLGDNVIEGSALVGCKFPYDADFSCAAMLDYHLDRAIIND